MKTSICLPLLLLLAAIAGAKEIKLKNPQFKMINGSIPGWRLVLKDKSGSCSSTPYKGTPADFCALKLTNDNASGYYGVHQGGFDLKEFPRPAADEILQITISFRQKNENVADGGFANVSFFSDKGYIAGRDTSKHSGTFDWRDVKVTVTFPEFPKDARYFSIRFYLGKTTGTVYFAEPKLYVDVVKKKK